MKKLSEKEWKPKKLVDDFQPVRGRESNMAMLELGNIPLISAKNGFNGVKAFVNTPKKLVDGGCITLNNDGDGGAGLAYYQPTEMALDTHVTALIPRTEMEPDAMLFTSECISGLHGFFGHGLSVSNKRVKNIKVMLPVTDSGEPDYAYMAEYAQQKRKAMLSKYRAYVEERIAELGDPVEIPALDEKEWQEYALEGLFSVGAGKRLTNADKIDGNRPFIGATDNSNGITGFVGNSNASCDRNVLGVNYNGAPCIAFYHPYECIFTDDVKRLHLLHHEDNEYVLLFFKVIVMQQRTKYSYGYKFKEKRMLRQKLMIPVDDDGKPDYEYMEQYVKNMMLRKYKQYLTFLERHK